MMIVIVNQRTQVQSTMRRILMFAMLSRVFSVRGMLVLMRLAMDIVVDTVLVVLGNVLRMLGLML